MKKYIFFFFILIIFGCNKISIKNSRVKYEQCNYGLSNTVKKSRFDIVNRNDSIFYIDNGVISGYNSSSFSQEALGIDSFSSFSYDLNTILKKNRDFFIDSLVLDSFINSKNKKPIYYLRCKECKSSYVYLYHPFHRNCTFDSLSVDSAFMYDSKELYYFVHVYQKDISNYPIQYLKKKDGIYLRYTKEFDFNKVYEHKQYSFNPRDSVEMKDMDYMRLQYNDNSQSVVSFYLCDTIIKLNNRKINCYKYKTYNRYMSRKEFSTVYIDKESLLPVMGSKLFYGLQAADVTNDWGYFNYYITDAINLKKDLLTKQWRPMNAEDFKKINYR